MSQSRIYHLDDAGRRLLVRAVSPSQATSFVARSRFPCRVASQDDLAELLQAGARVYDATDPDAPGIPAAAAPAPAEPIPVVAPSPSVAMAGVASVHDVLRHLAPAAVSAALGVDPAAPGADRSVTHEGVAADAAQSTTAGESA